MSVMTVIEIAVSSARTGQRQWEIKTLHIARSLLLVSSGAP